LIASGKLYVPVTATYPLSAIKDAVAHVERGGKVLLDMQKLISTAASSRTAARQGEERPPEPARLLLRSTPTTSLAFIMAITSKRGGESKD
jgi:hypothetical protein